MHTFIDYLKTALVWTAIGCAVGMLLFAIIYPIIIGDLKMLYIHIFLMMQLVMCFGVLRIYNSVFHNTRMSVELSKRIQQLLSDVPCLRKAITDNNRAENQAVSALRETIKGLRENSTKIDILNDEIKKWRQQNYGNTSRDNSGSRKAGK